MIVLFLKWISGFGLDQTSWYRQNHAGSWWNREQMWDVSFCSQPFHPCLLHSSLSHLRSFTPYSSYEFHPWQPTLELMPSWESLWLSARQLLQRRACPSTVTWLIWLATKRSSYLCLPSMSSMVDLMLATSWPCRSSWFCPQVNWEGPKRSL